MVQLTAQVDYSWGVEGEAGVSARMEQGDGKRRSAHSKYYKVGIGGTQPAVHTSVLHIGSSDLHKDPGALDMSTLCAQPSAAFPLFTFLFMIHV